MGSEKLVFTRKTSGLNKGLNWWDIFVIVVAAPAGSGILYYSVSTATAYPGGNVGLSFLIGMFIVLPVIFLAAISSSMIPRSGSLYVFISRTISPAVGFVSAWLFFLGYTLSVGVVAFVITQVIGGVFVAAGLAGNIGGLKSFGELLQNPYWATVGGSVLVILTWLLVLRGVKVFRSVMRVLFWIAIGSGLFTIGYFVIHSKEGTINLFNNIWGENVFQRILALASTKGWSVPLFSWNATFGLLSVVLFSYGGLELISYASGEMSSEKRNVKAYLAAWLVLAFNYIAIAFSVSYAYGDFISAYDFLVKKHPDALVTIMPVISPSIPFYISSIMPNIWIGIIVSLCLIVWFTNVMISYFFSPSRLIFALAMDHAIPESLADVDAKRSAPTKASHLTLLFALIGVFLNLLNVGTVLGTILFSALFVYWLYGLSAAILPYKSPELYKECPIQGTLFGIPIISAVGAVCFAIGWFVIFIAASQMTMDVVITMCVFMLIVLWFYVLQLKRNKERGIDIQQVYSQLPPE